MKTKRKLLTEIMDTVADFATDYAIDKTADYAADKTVDNIVGADESKEAPNVEAQEQEESTTDGQYKEIVVTQKMIRMFKRHTKGPEDESFKDFLSRGLNGATIVGFKRMPTRTGLAGSYKVRYIPVEEDAEAVVYTTDNNSMPFSTSGTPNPNANNSINNANDAMMTYIMQQIKQNRDKQKQEDQSIFMHRQQQADKIVKDIEDYIKKNKNK